VGSFQFFSLYATRHPLSRFARHSANDRPEFPSSLTWHLWNWFQDHIDRAHSLSQTLDEDLAGRGTISFRGHVANTDTRKGLLNDLCFRDWQICLENRVKTANLAPINREENVIVSTFNGFQYWQGATARARSCNA